ncbi:hypothetical protein DDZ14_16080 [Maritimibacter sp. 55A14]|uniref:phage tail protein n=1 Tax=Maritimibacter sp. 55A14 TaxID=2174844 RepID=UPI000D6227A3|nr:phage tail protein [Maritimibacter sp. 55A14]PWE29959.1 hypothetical protein DDZ14_16080 [Maritimibacter sp. 55A14]
MAAVGFAIAGVAGAIAVDSAIVFLTQTLVGRLLVAVAVSALSRVLAKKPKITEPGLRTRATQTGGTNPQSFILGTYATSGVHAAPRQTASTPGRSNNELLNYVITLGSLPGHDLSRLIVDGDYVALDPTEDPTLGFPVAGRLNGKAWIKLYDGTQTAADPLMLNRYPVVTPPLSRPADFPWDTDMVATGVSYAVLSFNLDRKLFKGFPDVRFEVDGIPLYDPRKDSSVGGSGAHRWADPATWEKTLNPIVMVYNVARGIAFPDGNVWGGGWAEADLPLSNWFAGMNECDVLVTRSDASQEPQYRAGLEVFVDDEPADVMDELLKAASAEVVDVGGTLKVRVGPPALPVWFFTDDDIVVTEEDSDTPFPDPGATHNAVAAKYPEPASLWEAREAPMLVRADLEAEDQGQRLVANLSLPAVPYGEQVQRLMAAWLEDDRRFRRHSLVLPPDALILEPLDTVAWTSARHGYADKLFEIATLDDSQRSGRVSVSMRERDPADFVPQPGAILPSEPAAPVTNVLPAQVVPNFGVVGTSIADAGGTARRPALELTWDGTDPDVRALQFEIRIAGAATPVITGSTTGVEDGRLIVSQGVLPAENYEARAIYVVDRPVDWTAWLPATTPDVRIGAVDISVVVTQSIDDANAAAAAAAADALTANARIDTIDTESAAALVFRNIGGEFGLFGWQDVGGTSGAFRVKADNILLDGTVAAKKLTVTDFSGNLVVNGNFGTGDFSEWAAVPAQFLVTPKDPAAPRNAQRLIPAAFALEMTSDPGTSHLTHGASQFPIVEGEAYVLEFDEVSTADADGTFDVVVQYLDQAGVFISADGLSNLAPGALQHRSTAMAGAPTGAVSGRVLVRRDGNETGGEIFVTNIEVRRKKPGSTLLTPNSVTADLAFFESLTALGITVASAEIEDLAVTSAKINTAAITNAKIGDLAVDTIKVSDNAITTTRSASGGLSAAVSWTPPFDGDVSMFAFGKGTAGGQSGATLLVGVGDGSTSFSASQQLGDSEAGSAAVMGSISVLAGVPITVTATVGGGTSNSIQLVVLETFK